MATHRSPLTPQFSFKNETGQYHWETGPNKGDFVPREAVRGALDDYLRAKEQYLREWAGKLQNREISIGTWQREMERNLGRMHVAATALAKGGWHAMGPADYGRAGGLLRREYAALRNFAVQIQNGLPLDGHFLQRIGQYAQAPRHTYHYVQRLEMEARGLDECRSIRHARDSCEECVDEEDKGWQPAKDAVLPGDRQCLRNCKCLLEYRSSQTGTVF